jgi:hypothetical protein
MILWAAHDGGYDADTWYWGALVTLSLVAVMLAASPGRVAGLSRPAKLSLLIFALYVGWSYLSIAWAGFPGAALEGSNRATLYLLVFALFAITPWTARRALLIELIFAVGIGVIAALMLLGMARGHSGSWFSEARLISPTGYFNSSAALFTMAALTSTALSVRRELPAALRGVLLGFACCELQLALLAQSRGWLFTLPLVIIIALVVVQDSLRVAAAALLPIAGLLVSLSGELAVWRAQTTGYVATPALVDAAKHAARLGLVAFGGVVILGWLLAATEARLPVPSLGVRSRRAIAAAAIVFALAAAAGGATAATHGHPFRFVSRQWHGFTHPSSGSSNQSHFAVVGSGRYDAWRVSLDALKAHPIGGLGQDNFADYYLVRRHTHEELQWTHSLEFRLLAHTGVVGFLLFAAFVVAAWTAALRNRRRGGLLGATVGVALLPFVVWFVHGSVDWFWEMPALSGPALGFLAMAGGLRDPRSEPEPRAEPGPTSRWRTIPRAAFAAVALVVMLAGVFVLGFPYLSVRKVSAAVDVRATNPTAALNDLSDAARLNPLSATPGRLGGAIALKSGQFMQALDRFDQAISREPGGWFSWLEAGLAASALGDTARARHDLQVAASLNNRQPAVTEALKRVDTRNPLSPSEALGMLQVAH